MASELGSLPENSMETGFEQLKATLQEAFRAPDNSFITLTADDIIARHKRAMATPASPSKPNVLPDDT